jgi:ABC-type multidrug transport system fused ATPase/permease subunit
MIKIPLAEYWHLLKRYLVDQRGAALLMATLLLASTGFSLVAPQVVRAFIDAALAGAHQALLMRTAIVFFVVTLIRSALGLLANYASQRVAWAATNALRIDLAAHLVRLDLAFHKAHPPGELIERVDGDVDALAAFLSNFVVDLIGSVLLLIGVLVAIAIEDAVLGMLFVVFSLFSLMLLTRVQRFAPPHWEADRECSAHFFGFLGEVLTATEDIRACGAVAYAIRQFYLRLRQWRPIVLRAHLWGMIWLAGDVAYVVGNALAWGVGGPMVRAGTMSLGTLYMIGHYLGMLIWGSISGIQYQLEDLQHAQASIVRVQALLNTSSDLEDGTAALPRGALSITFDHVSFGYNDGNGEMGNWEIGKLGDEQTGNVGALPTTQPPNDPTAQPSCAFVLHDLSFSLAPGRVLGLLGRTGSGKTTIARLLYRFYDPQQGEIRLGGVDLREAKIDALRARIGLVTQNVQLFQASLRENLTFFDAAVVDEDLVVTLETLGLSQWLERQPQGLDSPISGETLSAGEAQLVALARVFLKNPDLVILDEASSRLDPATEGLLGQALDRLLQGRSAVIIAHRLATVDRADDILILERGQAIECGPRLQLAAAPDSHFAGLLRTGIEEVLT